MRVDESPMLFNQGFNLMSSFADKRNADVSFTSVWSSRGARHFG